MASSRKPIRFCVKKPVVLIQSMHITVAICTWNRANLLDQTLTQMRNLRIPEGVTWELLVVNNNCTDETDAVLERHASQLPLRRLLETKQGLSNARNCAIAHATGELLLWTDDDVLVDPEWLAAYVDAAREFPDAAIFGGEVSPWFADPAPKWLETHIYRVGGVYAIRRARPHGAKITADDYPFGANMAFRTAVLREYSFDPELGRCGNGMRSGDETDVIRRILNAGRSGYWVPTARVEHYVLPSRMRPAYVYAFERGLSEGDALARRRCGKDSGFPRWAVRQWCESTIRRMWNCGTCNEKWLAGLRNAAWAHGELSAWWAIRSGSTVKPPEREVAACS